ncbi:Solute carrier family 35 member E1 [Trichinella pseudospiralis]|uniref:Solute carrier family 35 member E1 n=1 Tax=Trichinella pseudospiralis TaxID=6337 RepID=A0A0V1G177_TRIPS|nr:Solute carrier family 35 member E1 [Trichinella pseudospiralis]KRY92074.1 Solute carrier family 35 member E1 [Trichinella pseudospiralis]
MLRCRVNFGVLFLCLLWYAISTTSNILNKVILQNFPFPLTLTTASIVTTSIYSIPVSRRTASAEQASRSLNHKQFFFMVVPLAFGKLIAVSSSFVSLYKVPVSYAHTVKATMPIFSVVCARFIIGEKQTKLIYMSLIPILLGVMIATVSEMSFSAVGLCSALCSTFTYALMNAYVKKVIKDTGLHHVRLLGLIAQTSCILLLPVWLIIDVSRYGIVEVGFSKLTVCGLVSASGFLNFAQNVCTFSLINQLSVLSYAIANVTKRIIVISSSLITLKNPVTPVNVGGMLLAVVGVFGYTQVGIVDMLVVDLYCYPFVFHSQANQLMKSKLSKLPYNIYNVNANKSLAAIDMWPSDTNLHLQNGNNNDLERGFKCANILRNGDISGKGNVHLNLGMVASY